MASFGMAEIDSTMIDMMIGRLANVSEDEPESPATPFPIPIGHQETFERECIKRVVDEVKEYYKLPMCCICLESSEGVHLKARRGIDTRYVKFEGRDLLCNKSIGRKMPMVISDTTKDDRFANDPFVVGYPNVRFFMSAPLMMSSCTRFGMLCLMGTEPVDYFNVSHAWMVMKAAGAIVAEYSKLSTQLERCTYGIDTIDTIAEAITDGEHGCKRVIEDDDDGNDSESEASEFGEEDQC